MQRNDFCRRETVAGVAVLFVMLMFGQFQSTQVLAADLSEQLDFADSLYVRKMYDMAAHEYESYIDAAGNAPGTEVAYFRLGEARYNLKQYDKTAEALTALVKKFPNGDYAMRARLRLGEVLYRLGKYDDAVKYLDVAVKTSHDDTLRPPALYYLGQSYLASGKKDKAVDAFKSLINDYPRHGLVPYARFALATAYFEAKGFTNAAEQFASMAETSTLPSSLRAEAMFKAGLAHTENKEYDKGTALFDQTIREHPESPFAEQAAYERAWATYNAGKIGDADKLAKEFLKKYPKSKQCAGAKYLDGKCLQSLEKYAEAETVYAELVKKWPDDEFAVRARYQMCWTAYWLGRMDVAETRARNLSKTIGKDLRGETLFVLGRSMIEQKKYDNALTVFGEIIDKYPASKFVADAEFHRARALAELGKHAEAAAEFDSFEKKRPTHPLAPAARLYAAQQEFLAGSFDDAAAHYKRLAEHAKDAATRQTAEFMIGQAEQRAGQPESAVKAYLAYVKKFPKGPQSAEALYQAGVIQQQGDEDQAVPTYKRLLAEYPDSSFSTRARRNLGYLLYDKKDFDGAADAFVALLDDSESAPLPAETMLWLANHLYEEADYANSRKAYTIYVRDNSNLPESEFARVRTGDCAYYMHDYKAAEKAYRSIIKDDPDGVYRGTAHFGLGRVLLATDRADESIKEFTQAIETNDTAIVVQARVALGDAYTKLKNFDEAARAYMMVAMTYDDATLSPECYIKAAEALKAKGDPDAATKMYKELLSTYPKSKQAAVARTRLGSTK